MRRTPLFTLLLCSFTSTALAQTTKRTPSAAAIDKQADALFAAAKIREALAAYQRAANLGNAKAEVSLGDFYHAGGANKNNVTAAFWYQKAAEQGSAEGETKLGLLYQRQMQNYPLSLYWLKKADAQGYGPGSEGLGLIYEFGKGVPQNETMARSFFQKALAEGSSSAQGDLARLNAQPALAPPTTQNTYSSTTQSVEQPDNSDKYQHCAVVSQKAVQTGNANGMFVQVANSRNFLISIVAVSPGHRTVNGRSANDRGGGIGWNASTMGDAFLYVCPSPLLAVDASGNLPTAPNQTIYCQQSSLNTNLAGMQY